MILKQEDVDLMIAILLGMHPEDTNKSLVDKVMSLDRTYCTICKGNDSVLLGFDDSLGVEHRYCLKDYILYMKPNDPLELELATQHRCYPTRVIDIKSLRNKGYEKKEQLRETG